MQRKGSRLEESGFDFDFHTEVPDPQDALRREAETRLRDLAAEDTDMIGASAVVAQPVEAEKGVGQWQR